jgi:hypothetical protein
MEGLTMLLLFSNSLVLVGIIILIGSLVTVRKITQRLPLGSSRNSWYAMAALISFFVLGYLGYMIVFWNKHTGYLDLIVPGIFFFGACFVWLSSVLALQTAMDVMRITALEHEAFTDPLTGVYNRRFMEQRLRECIATQTFLTHFNNAQEPGVQMTVSIGVANFGGSTNDEESLIQVADQNLYQAKHGGRNQVVAEAPND